MIEVVMIDEVEAEIEWEKKRTLWVMIMRMMTR